VTPQDPITPLLDMAIQLHELKTRFEEAGFTNAEAMQLICAVIAQGMNQPPAEDPK
jgi:hypothetical protein